MPDRPTLAAAWALIFANRTRNEAPKQRETRTGVLPAWKKKRKEKKERDNHFLGGRPLSFGQSWLLFWVRAGLKIDLAPVARWCHWQPSVGPQNDLYIIWSKLIMVSCEDRTGGWSRLVFEIGLTFFGIASPRSSKAVFPSYLLFFFFFPYGTFNEGSFA